MYEMVAERYSGIVQFPISDLKFEISDQRSAFSDACLASRSRVLRPSADSIWRNRLTIRNASFAFVGAPLMASSQFRISVSIFCWLSPDRAAMRAAISARGLLWFRPA